MNSFVDNDVFGKERIKQRTEVFNPLEENKLLREDIDTLKRLIRELTEEIRSDRLTSASILRMARKWDSDGMPDNNKESV